MSDEIVSDHVDGPNPYSDRYDVSFVVYGATLDPEPLLKALRAKQHDLWRSGELRSGRTRRSSGIRVDVVNAGSSSEVTVALERFLNREAAFLDAVASTRREGVRAILQCAMWVYAMTPTTLSLPYDLLRRLGDRGIDWEVTGYPCAADEEENET